MKKKLSVSQKRKKNSKKNPKDLARACGMVMESKRKKTKYSYWLRLRHGNVKQVKANRVD